MKLFKKTERVIPDGPTWAEARERLHDNGYAACPVSFGSSTPRGPWREHRMHWHYADEDGIGLFTREPAAPSESAPVYPEHHLISAIELRCEDSKLRDAYYAAIREQYPDIERAPVRISSDGVEHLWLLKVDDYSFSGSESRIDENLWKREGFRNPVQVISGIAVILMSGYDRHDKPYFWERGSPVDIPRAELPAIGTSQASAIIGAVERHRDTLWRAPPWLRFAGSTFQ